MVPTPELILPPRSESWASHAQALRGIPQASAPLPELLDRGIQSPVEESKAVCMDCSFCLCETGRIQTSSPESPSSKDNGAGCMVSGAHCHEQSLHSPNAESPLEAVASVSHTP